MGNEQAQPSAVGSESGYKKYWIEMQRQPVTDIPPFRNPQISYLKNLFQQLDTKKQKSIEVDDFDNYYALRQHPLYERIRDLFRQQLAKIKVKRITFDIMLFLLSVFHIQTEIDQKYRYLFRMYDLDNDFKLGVNDLIDTFQILFYGPMYNESIYKMMAQQTIARYGGSNGFIKFEQFISFVPEDQVKQLMTLKFIQL